MNTQHSFYSPPAQYLRIGLTLLLIFTLVMGVGLCLPHQVLAQASATATQVKIIDPDDILANEDEELLRSTVEQTDLPAEVGWVVFFALRANSGNLDREIEDWGKEKDSSLLRSDQTRFEQSTLILAVTLDPRRAGVYCGDAVCQKLDLFSGPHLDATIEAMKPAFKRGNYPIGLLDGLKTALDPSVKAYHPDGQGEAETLFAKFVTALSVISLVGIIGLVMIFVLISIYRKIKDSYAHLEQTLSEQAFNLDEVKIRANSLTSPLAHSTLQEEWQTVLESFASVNDTIEMVRGWNHKPARKQLIKHGAAILEADKEVTRLNTAVDNINTLFEMEQGNADVRLKTLVDLGNDITEAIASSSSTLSREDLRMVQAQVSALEAKVHDEDFITAYVRVLGTYQNTLEGIAKREFGEFADKAQSESPAIYDQDWRVGTGTSNWVPFVVMHHTYTTSLAASSSDDDSWGSGSSGFSGDFSGGGGSSSW